MAIVAHNDQVSYKVHADLIGVEVRTPLDVTLKVLAEADED